MSTGDLDFRAINRTYWDSRAAAHAASADYAVNALIADPTRISDVIAFDRPRLGDLSGQRAVHLQCHIGTDTLSLARLGATVTGLDLSPASLAEAARLSSAAAVDITWVESDVLAAPTALGAGAFDLVYTSIGAICWIPRISEWAQVVADLLAPGGRLFLRDMHPMLGVHDVVDGTVERAYPYAEHADPLVFSDVETYVETDHELPELPTHEWSHGLGETVQAVLDAGLVLETLTEHDSVPWVALPGHMSPHPDHPGEYRLTDHPERMAASFTLTARRP